MLATMAHAGELPVKSFRYCGPYRLTMPVMIDSVDFNNKHFAPESLLDTSVDFNLLEHGKLYSGELVPANGEDMTGKKSAYALHLLSFNLTAKGYTKATVKVEGLRRFQLFVDGKKADGELSLLSQTHQVVIKYLSEGDRRDSLRVKVMAEKLGLLSVGDGKRRYTTHDVLEGKHLTGVNISYDGRYIIKSYATTLAGGRTERSNVVYDLRMNRQLLATKDNISWVDGRNAYYSLRPGEGGRDLVVYDLTTQQEQVVARRLPEGSISYSPKGNYCIVSETNDGPKEDADIYQIVEPDDRQPGWRSRSKLSIYRLDTGMLQPLTFGFHNVYLNDISADGRYLLLSTSHSRLTQRPTTLYSYYRLDLTDMHLQPVIVDDGFVAGAKFSPAGDKLCVVGSPECLGGVGKNMPEGRIPSMYDYQLYIVDVATRAATALTKNFNPSIENYSWSKADGNIYFTALDKDYCHLFCYDVHSGRIGQIAEPEDMVAEFDLANTSSQAVWYGESASNSERLYALNTRTKKSTLLEDLSSDILKGIELGKCEAWSFVNSRGDTISGRYYLPPDFDSTKKYPMIVNYYGGCSPTSRNFETRYPQHVYAAQGYVVYVINPSGAAGWGQEFSSRHVNTAGKGVADDIIEGTRKFCEEHPFVDAKKIGCIGASYGGFMTQYLQTQTDLFAAAISHAGISDHTSYWGEGYWGYSYSEVSMADSYPWTRKDLYVDRSPLFNADRIHTPLLFLHGNADTNVPFGESIQMFNALKLLGRETAFVVVNGQNHQILDYGKRLKWQNTIFAWFDKYLKGDATWWDALYPPKNL